MSSILTNLLEKGVPTREFQLATTGESSNEPIKIEGGKEGYFFNADFVMVAGLTDTHACQGLAVDDSGRVIITGQGARIDSNINPVIIGGMDGVVQRSVAVNSDGFLKIDLQNAALSATVNVDIDQSTDSIQLYGNDGAANRAVLTDAAGRFVMVGSAADGSAVSGNPVMIAGSDGINVQTLFTDATGRQVMVGAAANGAAVAGNPVLMAGSDDGGNVVTMLMDLTGAQVMVGINADSAPLVGNPVLVCGSDGANARNILTDSGGAQIINGKDAEGAAVTTNPIAVGGRYDATPRALTDGTAGAVALSAAGHVLTDVSQTSSSIAVYGNDGAANRVLKTDDAGRVVMVGGAANGTAMAGNPVLMAGSDGNGNVITMLVDSNGAQVIMGQNMNGTPIQNNNSVLVCGSDGTNARNILTDSAGAQIINGIDAEGAAVTANPIAVGGRYDATPRALTDGTAGAVALSAAGHVLVELSSSTTTIDVQGAQVEQAQPTSNPFLIGAKTVGAGGSIKYVACDTEGKLVVNVRGYDYANAAYQNISVNGQGAIKMAGNADEFSNWGADTVQPFIQGALDNTPARTLRAALCDVDGRYIVAGAAGTGTTVTGNPVLMAGSDGTNALTMLTDGVGRQIISGAETDGSGVLCPPLLICGSDANGNARTIKTDSSGNVQVSIYTSTQYSWFYMDLSSTPQVVTGATSRILSITIANEDTSAAFINLFNATSVTLGVDTPLHIFPCLAGSTVYLNNLQLDFSVQPMVVSLDNTLAGSGTGVYVTIVYTPL